MRQQDWTYLGQLVRALQMEAVDGKRIGEMVVEIEQYLEESGSDPVDEFGPPPVLARELAKRPGSKRPGWVPALWLSQLGVLVLLSIAMPLISPYRWEETTIPYTRGAAAYVIVFYLGVFWIGYSANMRLDGRTWRALNGWRFGLSILAVSAAVNIAFAVGSEDDLLSLPKVPYLIVCAIVIPAALYVLMRRNNPVRFPDNAQHLNPLKRGPLAGRAPSSARS
jgi:hypothetical protein